MADIAIGTVRTSIIGELVHGAVVTLKTWRERARGRAYLSRMSARDIHDLGLSRAQVQFELNKPFWRA